MPNDASQNHPAIALISAPWPLFNQPSIQLGALKAYLRQEMPQLPVAAHHLYLQVADSPVWRNPERYAIRAVANHPDYHALFPPWVVRQVTFLIQSYRGGKREQRRRWKPVETALRNWAAAYQALHSVPHSPPILSFRDGGEFLIIHQRRVDADPLTHRLEKHARRIYLFCQTTRPLAAIMERFPQLAAEKVAAFLREMVAKRLMFIENDRCLSLAIPAERCRMAPESPVAGSV